MSSVAFVFGALRVNMEASTMNILSGSKLFVI